VVSKDMVKCKTCDEQINPAEHEGCNYCDVCCHEAQLGYKPCENCHSDQPATHTVMTLSGELALCESCYND
jgi:hypothetical protein